jgi:hypothetical protein
VTAEWYDLAQRLAAARTRAPVARLAAAPVPRISNPVAVRARQRRDGIMVTAAAPGHPETAASGPDALALLHALGVRITAGSWRTLVTGDTSTLPALQALACLAGRDGPQADTAAHLAWWADRADFPGSSAVVRLTACCQARWITGTGPDAEKTLGTWLTWLTVSGSGCPAMLALLDRVQAGAPLRLLEWAERDDAYSWGLAKRSHAAGRDWRQPDTTGQAATGLRSRCDATELYAARCSQTRCTGGARSTPGTWSPAPQPTRPAAATRSQSPATGQTPGSAPGTRSPAGPATLATPPAPVSAARSPAPP